VERIITTLKMSRKNKPIATIDWKKLTPILIGLGIGILLVITIKLIS